MNKRDFIQRVIARSLPTVDKVEAGVRYAEQVWDKLTHLGYGAPEQKGPRDTRDWYQEMSAFQRGWFDQFWNAFKYKQGRNGAAKRWAQLEEDPKLYEQIVEGAKREAKRQRADGQVRKMAEGWLSERRWLDDTAPAEKKEDRSQQINNWKQDLAGFKRLQKAAPNDQLAAQIEALEQRIHEAIDAQ